MESMETFFFIGRVLLGGYFLYNAYNHLVKSESLTGYAKSKEIPMPKVAVIVSGLLLLFGGYTILAGVRVVQGVAALVLFLLPVTFSMHAFWKAEPASTRDGDSTRGGGQTREMEKVAFFKNIALLGAVLCLLAIPTPWPHTF